MPLVKPQLLPRTRMKTVLTTLAMGGIGLGVITVMRRSYSQAASGTPPAVFAGGPAFVSLPLESSEVVSHDTKRLRFIFPQNDAVSGLSLTSAVLTMSWPKGKWLPVARPYTPISGTDDTGFLDLLVKQYPNGKQSTHLHSLQPGQTLLFAAAIKRYQWQPNSFPQVTLIAGGAGITPVCQLARGILRNPQDKTAINLIFGVNSDEDLLLKEEFDGYEREFPGRFKATYVVSHPKKASPFRKGYITEELLRGLAPRPANGNTKVFVCGPPAMETSLVGKRGKTGALERLGYYRSQIQVF
ncbi:oxidoreductase NAD-binding domain-containing protein [Hirsutella rhossiliensis]|uniref:NADH-cytochrome b5 reductase n=1 Tax=Hirsutella rhossiliensis TaxID=111463 RepID=A0A9P8N7R4_9HYPO|nr:oxidoreductase NAD-binding domain-containing protein [Hirsutella rhossiliensis]KAH0968537.1 oxidoreductase NAD-binding domain-containing protein [Hirsutella rhossiliensis]